MAPNYLQGIAEARNFDHLQAKELVLLQFQLMEEDGEGIGEEVEPMNEKVGEEVESVNERVGEVKEGVASIALLPCGSISGHFIQLPNSICYGLHGTELACERECSRGEDHRLIKLTIIDYNSGNEQVVIVECRGHDAARFQNIDYAHGWDKEIVSMVEEKHGKKKIFVSFECETLKADKAAEGHIRKFMPKLAGLDAVVNIGKMRISGLDFESDEWMVPIHQSRGRDEV